MTQEHAHKKVPCKFVRAVMLTKDKYGVVVETPNGREEVFITDWMTSIQIQVGGGCNLCECMFERPTVTEWRS